MDGKCNNWADFVVKGRIAIDAVWTGTIVARSVTRRLRSGVRLIA